MEPGIVLNNLNSYLAQFNLFFPIVPASQKVCTLGGMISTNAAGERAIKYGRTVKWVLELEIVDGKGNLCSLKTKEAKELCGTEGTLGIITKAKLALAEPIKKRSVTLLKFDKLNDLVEAVQEFRSPSDVIAIEFFDKLSAKLSDSEEKYHLFIEFESNKGEIENLDELDRIWRLREGLGPVLSSAGFTIMEDPKIPLEGISEFLKWLAQNKIPSFGHIGIGIFHPRFKEDQKELIVKMFDLVKKLNGKVSGEHGIGIAKKRFVGKKFVNKISTLKVKYDPENILNRSKII